MHFSANLLFLRAPAPNDFPIILTGRITQRGRSYEPTLHGFFVDVFRERSGDRAIFRDAEKSREPRVRHTGELKHSVITRRTRDFMTRAHSASSNTSFDVTGGTNRFAHPRNDRLGTVIL